MPKLKIERYNLIIELSRARSLYLLSLPDLWTSRRRTSRSFHEVLPILLYPMALWKTFSGKCLGSKFGNYKREE